MTEAQTPLEQAHLIVDKLYQLTAELTFDGGSDDDDGDEKDVAAYAALVDAREPLVKALTALQPGLDAKARSSPEFAEIMQCIRDIADIDRTHLDYYEKLRDEMRGSIKEIKSGRKLNNAYNNDMMDDNVSRIDMKK